MGHIVGLCCCSSCYHRSRCDPCRCRSCCCCHCHCCSPHWCCTYTRPLRRCTPTFPSIRLSLCSPVPTLAFGRTRSCSFVCFVHARSCLSVLVCTHLCFDGSVCKFHSLSCIKYIVIRCIIIINTPLYPTCLAFICACSCLSRCSFVPTRLAFIRSWLCLSVLVLCLFASILCSFALVRVCLGSFVCYESLNANLRLVLLTWGSKQNSHPNMSIVYHGIVDFVVSIRKKWSVRYKRRFWQLWNKMST